MGRQYTPFEFTAKMINSASEIDAADMWNAFDEGITDGIDAYWEKEMILHYTKNPVVIIAPRNGSSGRSGYNVTVTPSMPAKSAYGDNLCQAKGQGQVMADACIEDHAHSAHIVIID